MSDTLDATTLTTEAPVALRAALAPAPAAAFDYDALVDKMLERGLVSKPAPGATPALPERPPSPSNLYQKGNLVTHAYLDPYDRKVHTRTGLVVDTLPCEDPSVGARSVVAWFADRSGPIGDHELDAG